MISYNVIVSAEIPYPWSKGYSITASAEGTAISRALRFFRQDLRARNGRHKVIKAFTVRIRRQHPVEAPATGGGSMRGLYKRGQVWYCRLADADGQIIRKRLASDRRAAEQILAEMRRTRDLQRAGLLPAHITKQVRLLADLRAQYLAHLQAGSVAAGSIGAFQTAWSQLVVHSGWVYVADVTLARVEAWAKKRLQAGTRGQTINLYVLHVRTAPLYTTKI